MDYINEDTGEWGLCEGDVALDPDANWAEIHDTTKPEITFEQEYVRLPPKKINGKWYEQWDVKDLTDLQLQIKKTGMIEEQ
jgi:hypothetical protein